MSNKGFKYNKTTKRGVLNQSPLSKNLVNTTYEYLPERLGTTQVDIICKSFAPTKQQLQCLECLRYRSAVFPCHFHSPNEHQTVTD